METNVSGRPRVFTVGWVIHGLGTVGLTVAVLIMLSWMPRMAGRTVDKLIIGAGLGAGLLVLGVTSLIGVGLRARRTWAPGLALARAILALLFVAALFVSLPLLLILPMLGLMLIGPWFAALVGEILLCIGGFRAFLKRPRPAV